ncbi:MAG: N-6 DNA methylase, partial [Thermoproteus sp.]|nr:N-6 DNA methylase [Thermoproteus sp.]
MQKEYILKSYDNIDKSVLYELLEDVVKVAKGEKIEEQRGMFTNLLKLLKIFVDLMDKRFVRDALKSALINNKSFREKLDELAKENGYEKGLASLVGENFENVERLSKMMVYVLLNKIIFYKILSKYYEGLRPLSEIYQPGQIRNIDDYLERLNKYFEEAISTTKNFEAIFITDLYDNIKISDEEEAMKTIDDIIRIIREFDPMDFADIIGQIYDELIDPKERHALGQFYTPPLIARLITNWAIRSPNDKVLDPGCGSGTFISKAYSRLAELKTGKKQRYTSPDVHAKILDQIYGIDINAFAVQLASMHLAIKNPYSPSTNINIVNRDFFEITPEELVPSSYKVITPKGEKRREMAFRDFDAVIGNPPYTRWTEMSVKTRNAIKAMIGNLLERYNLMPNVGAGMEPQIYVYWIMHSTKFLKEGGRLGMIISNAWLSTDYGIRFGNFLLDRYRITALID